MKVKKLQDTAAQAIRFGVEIETMIPLSAQVDVGGYHSGAPVVGGYTAGGEYVQAPTFDGPGGVPTGTGPSVATPAMRLVSLYPRFSTATRGLRHCGSSFCGLTASAPK
jgi:hypothetical protein